MRRPAKALGNCVLGAEEAPLRRAARLLRAIEKTGHAENDLVAVGEVEQIMSKFTQELVQCIPVQHHEAMQEVIEKFGRRLMASAYEDDL